MPSYANVFPKPLNRYLVYELWGKHNELLYVGQTTEKRLRTRMRQHYSEKDWVRNDVVRVEIVGYFECKPDVLKFEFQYIWNKRPKYNINAQKHRDVFLKRFFLDPHRDRETGPTTPKEAR